MEENLKDSLLIVCGLLKKHNVKYMLIGGTAVALNGYYRYSITDWGESTIKPDIDIWYNPTYENYYNLLRVIEELGQDITEFKNEQSPNPRKSFFKLDLERFAFDMLPEITGNIRFSESDKRKGIVEIDTVPVCFMDYFDLIKHKQALSREKDIDDIEQLKRIRGEE